MNNLVPVKRHDRNGKLVTRHIKSQVGSAGAMTNVPAPKLSVPAMVDVLTDGVSLVPSQVKRKQRTETGAPVPYQGVPAFDASEVEMYGVLAVTSPVTALRLLVDGVRSAEEAEERLYAEGLEDELTDNAGMSHQMLLRRVPAEFYLMSMERLSDDQIRDADPALLADYAEFFSIRSIMRKDSPRIADEVLRGEIRLSDVRLVGIDHLKTNNRLEISSYAFRALARGTDKFTYADLSLLLQSNMYERTQRELTLRVQYMVDHGAERLRRMEKIGMDSFSGFSMTTMAVKIAPDDVGDRTETLAIIDYTMRCIEASELSEKRHNAEMIKELCDKGKDLFHAGVDVSFAANRIHRETAREITADYEGTHSAVGSGWL